MKYTRFENLPCWQKARELRRAVYRLFNKQQFFRDYSLKDQKWRAAGSAMDNIAEGLDDLRTQIDQREFRFWLKAIHHFAASR